MSKGFTLSQAQALECLQVLPPDMEDLGFAV